jgi:ABC-2 type transport system permease protein
MLFVRLAYFHGRQLLRTPFFLQEALLSPLVFFFLRTLGELGSGQHLPGRLWVDGSIAGLWATTTLAVGIIGFQRFQGTLEHLAMSVLAPGRVFGSLAASATLIGVIGIPLCLIAQLLVSGRIEITVGEVVGVLCAMIACAASASLMASVFVLLRSATVYEPLILAPVWLLTGVALPLTSLPGWLVPIALLHPLTAAVLATRASSPVGIISFAALSLVTAGVWLAVASLTMRSAMRRARIAGTLGLS